MTVHPPSPLPPPQVDEREPDIMRFAPHPLYNSFTDALRFFQLLKEALENV